MWLRSVKAYNHRSPLSPNSTLMNTNITIPTLVQGFAPLCAFLNVSECPEEPIPHVNSRAKMKTATYAMKMITWVFDWSFFLLVAYVAWWTAARSRRL